MVLILSSTLRESDTIVPLRPAERFDLCLFTALRMTTASAEKIVAESVSLILKESLLTISIPAHAVLFGFGFLEPSV